jgi:hypothetical protein
VNSYTPTHTAIVNAQDYYPFGERIRYVTGDPYNDRYKFTEKERDLETGYDYFGARYYDIEFAQCNNYRGWYYNIIKWYKYYLRK